MTKLFFIVGKDAKTSPSVTEADGLGYVNQYGLSRKHIFESVKHSLERLQLDYVDVLQCHRFDENTPIEETMRALHDVVQAGYARYIGMSSCYAWQFQVMQNYAITNNLTPFISMQNHYSLAYREEEREMMPTLKYFGVGSIPWSPLARGFLTRPPSKEVTARGSSDAWSQKYAENSKGSLEIVKKVEELSKKYQVSMAQISLAWVLSKDVVTAPIIGTTSMDNLRELIDAIHIKLSDEDIEYLQEPYEAQPIFGH